MGKYIWRVVSYIIKVSVVVAAVLLFMTLTHMTTVSINEQMFALLHSTKGYILVALLLLLALLNPKIGFVTRETALDVHSEREVLVNAFVICGYTLSREEGGQMVFRAESPMKRAMRLWDDAIVVTHDSHNVFLSGPRKEVVRIMLKLATLKANQ